MKHPLLILCGLVVVVLFTALIAPFLINWNAYRAEIENEARRILGHQVVITGDIDIRLLPSGTIRFAGVEVKSPASPNSAALASIELVKAKLALAPLLRGKFQFTDIELVRPTFRFEVSSRGVPNWEVETGSSFGGLIKPKNIILDDVQITSGAIFFRDAHRQIAYDISAINARISARALIGPYTANGTLVIAGQKREFTLRAGRGTKIGVRRVHLRLVIPDKEDEQITLDGFLDTSDKGPRFDGKVILRQEINQLDFFYLGTAKSKDPLFGRFEAEVATSFAGIRFEEIKAMFTRGDHVARFTGRAQVLWQDSSEFVVELKSKRVDMDGLFGLKGPDTKTGKAKAKPGLSSQPSQTSQFLALMAHTLPGIWRNGFDGRASLDIGAIVIGGLTIEKSKLNLRFADNHIEVLDASGNLPGRSRLALKGLFLARDNLASFDGSFNFKADNAKGFVRWIAPALSPLMGTKVSGHNGKLQATGDVRIGPKSIDLLDIVLILDETRATAGLSYALRQRPAFGLALSLDRINLDRYFPARPANVVPSQNPYGGGKFLKDLADLFVRFDANIRLNASTLMVRGITTRGFAADIGLESGRLTINKLNFSDIGGGSLRTKGTISDINGKPTGVLEARLVAEDPTDLFNLLGIGKAHQDSAQKSKFALNYGPLKLDLSFGASFKKGQPQRLFKVEGFAGDTKISSQLRLFGQLNDVANAKIDFTAEAQNKNGTILLTQLGWREHKPANISSQVGGIKARIKGDINQRLEIGFDLQAHGTKVRLEGSLANSAGEPLLKADVTLKSKDVRPLMAVLKVPVTEKTDGALPLAFHGLLTGKLSELVLTGFDGTVGKNPIKLNGTVTMAGAVPKVELAIQTEEVSFAWMFNALFGGAEKSVKENTDSDQVWSAQPFDLTRLKAVEMEIDLRADKILTATTAIEGARVEISSRRGKFDLKRFSGKIYGGELSFKATLDDVEGSLKLASEYTLIDGDLSQIARIKEKRWAIGGTVYISGHVKGQGRSVRGLVSSMDGAGVLKIQKGVLNGINPSTFAKALSRVETESELNSIIDGILAEGKLFYGDLDSSYTINGGLVGTNDLHFKSEGVAGKTSLVIDLTVLKIDNEWRFSFDDFPDSPPLLLLYSGAINSPDRKFDAEGLRSFLVVKTLKDSVKRLENIEAEERNRRAREKSDVTVKQKDPVDETSSDTQPDAL